MCALAGQHRDDPGGERADAAHAPVPMSAMLGLVDQAIAAVEATELTAQRAIFRRLGGPDMVPIAREAAGGLRIWRAIRAVLVSADLGCPSCGHLLRSAGHVGSPSHVPAGGQAGRANPTPVLSAAANPLDLPAAVPDRSPAGEAGASISSAGASAENCGAS